MARLFVEGNGNAGQASLVLLSSGGLFLVGMIAMSLLIISMVIFACGDHNSGSPRQKKGELRCGGGLRCVGSHAGGTILTGNYGGNMVAVGGGGGGGGGRGHGHGHGHGNGNGEGGGGGGACGVSAGGGGACGGGGSGGGGCGGGGDGCGGGGGGC